MQPHYDLRIAICRSSITFGGLLFYKYTVPRRNIARKAWTVVVYSLYAQSVVIVVLVPRVASLPETSRWAYNNSPHGINVNAFFRIFEDHNWRRTIRSYPIEPVLFHRLVHVNINSSVDYQLQRLCPQILGMEKKIQPILYNGYNYLSALRFKLYRYHACKGVPVYTLRNLSMITQTSWNHI